VVVRDLNSIPFPKLIACPMSDGAREGMELLLQLMQFFPENWMNLFVDAKLCVSEKHVFLALKNMLPFQSNVKIYQNLKIVDNKITQGKGQIIYPHGNFNSFQVDGLAEDHSIFAAKTKKIDRFIRRIERIDGFLWSPIVCKYDIDQSWRRPIELVFERDCLHLKSLFDDSSSIHCRIELSFSPQFPQTLKVEPNNLAQNISYSHDTVVWQIEAHKNLFSYKLSFQGAQLTRISGIYQISGNLKDSSKAASIKIDSKTIDLARVSYETTIEETLTIGH
jgi:hypothetical protein